MAVKNLKFVENKLDSKLEDIVEAGLRSSFKTDRNGRMYARDTYCSRRNSILAVYKENVQTDGLFSFYTEIGNVVEDIVLRAFRKQGVLVDFNYGVEFPGLNLGGKIDAIVFVNDKLRILEIKTISKNPDKPKDSHLKQAETYAAATGLDYSVVYVPRTLHTFVGNKIKLDMKSFHYQFDEAVLRPHLYTIAQSHYSIEKNVLPPFNKRYKTQCEYCQFANMCWDKIPLSDLSLLPPTILQEEEIHVLSADFVENYFNDITKKREEVQRNLVKRRKVTSFDYSKIK